MPIPTKNVGNRRRRQFEDGPRVKPERRVAYIHGLVVDKAHRRAGCAAILIEHVKQEARRQDVALMGIDFWSFNDAARACFEKAGFKVSREFMWLGL